MKRLEGSNWGLKVDKSKATESYPVRGTSFPKESGLNHSTIKAKPSSGNRDSCPNRSSNFGGGLQLN